MVEVKDVLRLQTSTTSRDYRACSGKEAMMRIVYISTAGSGDPTKASLPWHLAVNGSVEEGHDVVMVMAGDSTDLVVGAASDSIEGVGVPPLRDLLQKARKHEVPVFV